MVIDSDAHVTTDNVENLRDLLPESLRLRKRFVNLDEYDRNLGETLGRRGLPPEQHLRDMDQDGIDVQILFPTGLLNLGNKREVDAATALAHAYNNWVHTFCSASPQRLRAASLVALQDVAAATREMARAATELRMRAVMIPTFVYPGKDLGSRDLDPFYAEAERLGVTVAVHRVSGPGTVGFERFTNFLAMHSTVPTFELATAVTNMVMGGVFERFPRLKVAYLEGGVRWLPWLVERLDEHYKMRAAEVPSIKAAPSEYLRSGRIFFTFEPGEGGLTEVVEVLGERALLFASDYPHWDAPADSVRLLRERSDLPQKLRSDVFETNPRACFGIT